MNDFEKHLREVGEVGFVERVNRAIVHVSGLPGAHPYEVVLMESGETGQVLSLGEELMEILVFLKLGRGWFEPDALWPSP